MDRAANGSDARGLRTVPPGFGRGLRLPGEDLKADTTLAFELSNMVNPKSIDGLVRTGYTCLASYVELS